MVGASITFRGLGSCPWPALLLQSQGPPFSGWLGPDRSSPGPNFTGNQSFGNISAPFFLWFAFLVLLRKSTEVFIPFRVFSADGEVFCSSLPEGVPVSSVACFPSEALPSAYVSPHLYKNYYYSWKMKTYWYNHSLMSSCIQPVSDTASLGAVKSKVLQIPALEEGETRNKY